MRTKLYLTRGQPLPLVLLAPFSNLPKTIQGCLLLPVFLPLCLSSPIFSLLAGPAALPADAAAAAAAAAAAGDADGVVEFL